MLSLLYHNKAQVAGCKMKDAGYNITRQHLRYRRYFWNREDAKSAKVLMFSQQPVAD
jgi:hypothetical protein